MFKIIDRLRPGKNKKTHGGGSDGAAADTAVTFEALKALFEGCDDLETHSIVLGGAGGKVKGEVCFFDGMTDCGAVGRDIIRPLTEEARFAGADSEQEAARRLSAGAVSGFPCSRRDSLEDVAEDMLSGCCVLILDGLKTAYSYQIKSHEKRGVEKPENEKSLKGAKDSFTENYRSNTALMRSKLKSADVKISESKVGRRSHTRVGLVYIRGLTSPKFIEQAKKRLKAIDIDGLLTAGDIEEYLIENTATPFPQMIVTERPDKFCIGLLEGRIGILADGLPYGFMLPVVIGEFFKVPDDNAEHFLVASMVTALRYIASLLSVTLPALYVAVTMYHQGMIPTKLMLSVIQSRQDVPFSTIGEVLSMLIAFELLQEAGLRLPKSIGETVSIIGALIVGQSAVEAKLLSPAVVILVALSGITGYTMPDQDMAAALRLCRFALTILAVATGMFGIVAGVIIIVYHLSTLETLGVAYTSPYSEADAGEMIQTFLRLPLKSVKFRKKYMMTQDRRKQK